MRLRRIASAIAALVLAPLAWVYANHGLFGMVILIWHGPQVWAPVTATDPRLTPAVKQALAGKTGVPGVMTWTLAAPGFETSALPILVDGVEADRIILARIDPTLWQFSVHTDLSGLVELDHWMQRLNAALVVNGSYFDPQGEPATPLKSGGRLMGPATYTATHGALVIGANGPHVVDLLGQDWQALLATGEHAMVSYPLLLDATGSTRAKPSQWLAGRSFVGEDNRGRIIVGTSVDALLTLPNLASVLKSAPLDLKTALNLDGGPIACLAIAAGSVRQRTCGPPEVQVNDGEVSLLTGLTADTVTTRGLPIVLAVTPR